MGQSVKLGGLDVDFPYQPYGIQRAMMAKIIVAYSNRQNCLIESPTGTGKSLSLICSSLAWQKRSKQDQRPFVSASYNEKQVAERMARLNSRPCTCGARPSATSELDQSKDGKEGQNDCRDLDNDGDESATKKIKANLDSDITSPLFEESEVMVKKDQPVSITIDSNGNELAATQMLTTPNYFISEPKDTKIEGEVEFLDDADDTLRKPLSDLEPDKQNGPDRMCKNCWTIKTEQEMGPIYYGTRTHKQITQIVRELKKTSYTKDLKMNILSSRDRTCINDKVRDCVDRDDQCKKLVKKKKKKSLNDPTCSYFRDFNQMAKEFSMIYQKQEAFDIEDAVDFGKQTHLCPYFGMRALQEQADITFCPYNYILDSNIRSAMNISLKNSIVILDEAHNIEDICRERASFVINTRQIDDLLDNIKRASFHYIQGSSIRDAYDFFKNLFTDLKAFLLKFDFGRDFYLRDGDCLSRKVMSHPEMLNSLSAMNLGSKNFQAIRDNLKALRGDEDETGQGKFNKEKERIGENQDAALNNLDLQMITQLSNTLDFIHSQDGKNSTDYRCIVSKHLGLADKPGGADNQASDTKGDTNLHRYQFSLMCMNPALAFRSVHQNCWAVVVASGTLSPIESLKTELGCKFSQVFEGSHVIPDDRIFATILSSGPNGIDLNFSYANSLMLEVQDELGQVVRDVCRTVPSGVLIFFPSYERMENLYQRWSLKGYVSEIKSAGKRIFRESKNQTAAKFDDELIKYYEAATGKGAVMMGVYRGKISEGIDFSDSAARAVISIGIPFPSVREVTISLKREYNDQARRERPELMTGSNWYQTQGMRALNQSLGRVIRHKDDWGAIIMLDSRLRYSSNMIGISKWVRRCIAPPSSYEVSRAKLEDFVRVREGSKGDRDG